MRDNGDMVTFTLVWLFRFCGDLLLCETLRKLYKEWCIGKCLTTGFLEIKNSVVAFFHSP